jgi:hypothetical protein
MLKFFSNTFETINKHLDRINCFTNGNAVQELPVILEEFKV